MVTLHPPTLQEALALLAETGASPVAGGTDWMLRQTPGHACFFLNRIEALHEIRAHEGGVSIGAGCTYAALLDDPRVPAALRDAAAVVASPAIRNLGTLGGNLCNASPAGDTLPVLYALDADVELHSLSGVRTLPVASFITGVRQTALRPDELLVRVRVPAFDGVHRFDKVGSRRAQAISKCSFAGFLRIAADTVEDARLAFGAVGPTVIRSRDLERRLCGLSVSQARAGIGSLVAAYGEILMPIDDARSTAAYRKGVCLKLLSSFLRDSLAG